jgi:hypothetical protein
LALVNLDTVLNAVQFTLGSARLFFALRHVLLQHLAPAFQHPEEKWDADVAQRFKVSHGI